jgi:hypothetical protein
VRQMAPRDLPVALPAATSCHLAGQAAASAICWIWVLSRTSITAGLKQYTQVPSNRGTMWTCWVVLPALGSPVRHLAQQPPLPPPLLLQQQRQRLQPQQQVHMPPLCTLRPHFRRRCLLGPTSALGARWAALLKVLVLDTCNALPHVLWLLQLLPLASSWSGPQQ